MSFVEDDDMVQTISAGGSDNAFTERILPRRARGRKHFVDAETFYSIAESFTIDAIAITQQITWSGIERERLY